MSGGTTDTTPLLEWLKDRGYIEGKADKMSKHKTHYEIVTQDPNESDPDGWSEILCNVEYSDNLTTDKKHVTCKNCLRLLDKGLIEI